MVEIDNRFCRSSIICSFCVRIIGFTSLTIAVYKKSRLREPCQYFSFGFFLSIISYILYNKDGISLSFLQKFPYNAPSFCAYLNNYQIWRNVLFLGSFLWNTYLRWKQHSTAASCLYHYENKCIHPGNMESTCMQQLNLSSTLLVNYLFFLT